MAGMKKRNMTYGCDHGGRGYDLTEFGDYFRTQKYNQGPGCDQPNLASDIIKNKVASSISHLYGRKRTWLEGFYGSGWGKTEGLAFYSGKALYRQSVEIKEEQQEKRMVLEIDNLSSSATVLVNGSKAGTKVSASWQFDITPYMHKGKNEIQVCVSNTLANHYKSIPSRYCKSTESGILGAARLLIYE